MDRLHANLLGMNFSRSVVICATKWFDRDMVKENHSCETGSVQVQNDSLPDPGQQ